MGTKDRWYENAVFYAIDVETFADADSDGVGDFAGLTERLEPGEAFLSVLTSDFGKTIMVTVEDPQEVDTTTTEA